MLVSLHSLVHRLTCPCKDDGTSFTITARLREIADTLAGSAYRIRYEGNLVHVYQHTDFDPQRPLLMLSCHVDSVYEEYNSAETEEYLLGTYDNSACNAAATYLMAAKALPPQVLVAFTGDEEYDSGGADEAVALLQRDNALFARLELVVCLDLTEVECDCGYTIENCFHKRDPQGAHLHFHSEANLAAWLRRISLGSTIPYVPHWEAVVDESWQYDEHDVNCFTLGLVCRCLDGHMHNAAGVAIAARHLAAYAAALADLCTAVNHALEADRPRG